MPKLPKPKYVLPAIPVAKPAPKQKPLTLHYTDDSGRMRDAPNAQYILLEVGELRLDITQHSERIDPSLPHRHVRSIEIAPRWDSTAIVGLPIAMHVDVVRKTTQVLGAASRKPPKVRDRTLELAQDVVRQYRRIARKVSPDGPPFPVGCRCGKHVVSYIGQYNADTISEHRDIAATCRTFTDAMERLQAAMQLEETLHYETIRRDHITSTNRKRRGQPASLGTIGAAVEPAQLSAEPFG